MALCTNTSSTSQVLEAMKWYFGKRHCRTITFTDDSPSDYFDLNVIGINYEEKKYLVFLDDGVATPPTPASGQTLITVDCSSATTAEQCADAFVAQLVTSEVEVRYEQETGIVECQNNFVGVITEEDYTNAAETTQEVGATGFGGYLGQSGESEMTTTTDKVQILDDAQGTVIQDEIITGQTIELSLPLREMTSARWESLIGNVAGDNYVADTKTITGYGTSKLYKSMFLYSGRLVGHPVRNVATNIDQDVVVLNTAPNMDSINFSGSSLQEASFTFVAYKDGNAPEEINIMARGDHSLF